MVIGNWKMNPDTIGKAKKLFLDVRKHINRKTLTTFVAIAPPAPYCSELERLSPSQRIKLVAQDMFYEKSGAYTGEISLSMLQSVGVQGVIIGHSERRALGDSAPEINAHVKATLAAKLTPILCIGELERDAQGNYFSFIEQQLHTALAGVAKSQLRRLVIAYEPVWAIGTGNNATPEDVYEMKLFITKILTDQFGRTPAAQVRILYGGSVKPDNAEALLTIGNVDGFLVGGASLKSDQFVSIITITETYAKR